MTQEYASLVTSEHRDKARFMATLRAVTEPLIGLQEELQTMPAAFSVDEAIGVQLDAVGLWVGIGRTVKIPINTWWFSWDDSPSRGWDAGIWKGIGDEETGDYNLPDDLYRRLIKAKIRANNWKCDIPGAYEIVALAFARDDVVRIYEQNPQGTNVFSWDIDGIGWDEAPWSFTGENEGSNRTMFIFLNNDKITPIEEHLLINGYLPLKPAGVRVICAREE